MAAISGATHLHSEITGLFDAIRSKAGVSGSMTFAEAASAVGSITGGGGDGMDTVQKLITGWPISSVPQAEADAVTVIPSDAFHGCTALMTASFPSCTTIGSDAFCSCSALTTASFPVCTAIENGAFEYTALTTASFPNCATIGNWAFYNCSALTTASFPVCTAIENGAFEYTALTTASFPNCATIGSMAFYGCAALMSLYLMSSSVVSLVNVNAFINSPLSAEGSGTIYVPSNLWSDYQVAENWSTISARIVSA